MSTVRGVQHTEKYTASVARLVQEDTALEFVLPLVEQLLALEPVSNGEVKTGLPTPNNRVRAIAIKTANKKYIIYYAFNGSLIELLDLCYRPDTIWDEDVQGEFSE